MASRSIRSNNDRTYPHPRCESNESKSPLKWGSGRWVDWPVHRGCKAAVSVVGVDSDSGTVSVRPEYLTMHAYAAMLNYRLIKTTFLKLPVSQKRSSGGHWTEQRTRTLTAGVYTPFPPETTQRLHRFLWRQYQHVQWKQRRNDVNTEPNINYWIIWTPIREKGRNNVHAN